MQSSQKNILRKQALSARRSLPPSVRKKFSDLIQGQLLHRFSTSSAQWLIYRSRPEEVCTTNLFLNSSIHPFAPVAQASGDLEWRSIDQDTRWRRGMFGVEEPENGKIWRAAGRDTQVICPLVGFDRSGGRLGFGRGFFDRWLDSYHAQIACRIGLAFSCQELTHIPTEEHDVSLDYIVTEEGVITCRTS